MSYKKITCRQVAEFRYSVLGELFARPPAKGELAARLREISNKDWHPPGCRFPERYCIRTLERWYAQVKKNPTDPVTSLLPERRSDLGIRHAIKSEHMQWIKQYLREYSGWTTQLLVDNLAVVPHLQPTPSYSTVLRWLHSIGIYTCGIKGKMRKKNRETLSFESMFSGEIWHLDMHSGSRKVLLPNGEYIQPKCIAYIDDHSRLVSHCQWVTNEDAAALVHITKQAFLKYDLPQKIHSDNGSAMISEEYETGLLKLGIKHDKIIPGLAFQNGKIESFWRPLEARLIKMLANVKPLTLEILNQYTQPWVMYDYNGSIHSETGQKPVDRYAGSKNVARKTPDFITIGKAFRRIIERTQRFSDGTISIDGVKFQTPRPYRHIKKLFVAYAQWDLSEAALVDEQTGIEISPIFPLDKNKNALGMRAPISDPLNEINVEESEVEATLIPPLLAKCMREFQKTSPVIGYIPHLK